MTSLPNQVTIAHDEPEERISSDSTNTPVKNHDSVQRSLVGPSFHENLINVPPIRKGSILVSILLVPTIRYLRALSLQLLITSFQTNYTLPVTNKATISKIDIRGDSPANFDGYHKKVTYSSTINSKRAGGNAFLQSQSGGNAFLQSQSQQVAGNSRRSFKQRVIEKRVQSREPEIRRSDFSDMGRHTIHRVYDSGVSDYDGSEDAPIYNLNNIQLHFNISGPMDRLKQELLDVMKEKKGRQSPLR